jgi:hypothetical protein
MAAVSESARNRGRTLDFAALAGPVTAAGLIPYSRLDNDRIS